MERSFVCRLDIGRSRYLLAYLFFVHLLMTLTLVVLFIDIGWLVVIVLVAMITSLVFQLQQYGWIIGGHTIKTITCNDGAWTIACFDEHSITEIELVSSYVSPLVTLLYFRVEGKWRKTTVVMVRDAVDSELFRRLRVMLRDPKTFQK